MASGSTRTTVIVGAIALAVIFVVWLGLMVASQPPGDFDSRIMLALRRPGNPAMPRGPDWLFAAMRDITALGDSPVLTLVTAIVAGFALIRRRIVEAGFVAATVAIGAIVDTQMKLAFARPRPGLVPHLVDVTSASFPSGHAMNSAVACLTIGALIASHTADRATRTYVAIIGVGLTLAIGASRVYLGVHYPTDVIAGWVAGAAWATACWLVAARWLGHPAPGGALPLAVHPAKPRRP